VSENFAGEAPGRSTAVHGSAVAWCGRGILLLGAPGSGKSSLLLQLLAAGGQLVADDLIRLERRGHGLGVSAAGAPGLIELRGNGIFRTTTMAGAQVSLCVELVPGSSVERLPTSAVTRVADVELPLLRVASGAADGAAQVLMALIGQRAD
jgi:HPr kinase/phosphorylase